MIKQTLIYLPPSLWSRMLLSFCLRSLAPFPLSSVYVIYFCLLLYDGMMLLHFLLWLNSLALCFSNSSKLICVAVVYSILLLHGFPMYEYVTIYLSILLLMGMWIVSSSANCTAMNNLVYICWCICVRAFLGQIPPVELPGSSVWAQLDRSFECYDLVMWLKFFPQAK